MAYGITVNGNEVTLSFSDNDGGNLVEYRAEHTRANRLLSTEARKMVHDWASEGRSAALTAERLIITHVDISGLAGIAYRIIAADLAARIEEIGLAFLRASEGNNA